MIRDFVNKLSLKVVLLIPFVGLIVTMAGFTSYLAFRNGQLAVNDVTSQLCDEIAARVTLHLDEYLSQAHLINRLNAVALDQGLVDPDDLDVMAHFLWQRGQVFEGIGTIAFANARGEVVSANGPENYIGVASPALTGGAFRRYAVDAQGYRSEQVLSEVPGYDVHDRGWYRQAVAVDHPTWAAINLSLRGQELDATAILPYRDRENSLQGVFFVDVSLAHLTVFLSALEIGQSGKVYIIEPDGLLVASSVAENLLMTSGDVSVRRPAADSSDPVIALTAKHVIARLGDDGLLGVTYSDTLEIQGTRYYLHATPYEDAHGLSWWVVVVIPDTDFMARIRANTWHIGLIIGIAFLVTIVVAFFVARWVTLPLAHLSRSAQALAQGDWNYPLEMARQDEVGKLAQAFNVMTTRLQSTFASLQAGEVRYRSLFEHSPVSLWEEDFSQVKLYLESLQAGVETDWRVYFEQHPEVLAECATRVRVADVNRTTLDLFGALEKSAMLDNLSDILDDEAFAVFGEELLALLAGQQTFEAETVNRTFYGTELFVKLRLSVIPGHADTWSKILVSLADITEQKRIESELRESERRFRSIVENTEAGYFFIDRDGLFRNVNPAWLRLYRYDAAEEVLGQHFTIVQKLDDVELAEEFVAGIMRGDPQYLTGEFSRRCKDGTSGYHSFSARPVARLGEVQGIEGFIIDTTERRMAEQALQESRERFRALFETMTEGVALHELVYDDQDIPYDYRILDINPAYVKHTGLTRQVAIGATSSDFYHGNISPYFATYRKVVETGSPIHFEAYFEPLRRYFRVSAFSPTKGQFATIFEDITEYKQTEQALHEKTEELDRFFSLALDLLCIADFDGRFRRLNPQWEKTLGYTLENLEGRRFLDFVHPDDVESTLDTVSALSSGKTVTGFVNRYRCDDGTYRWIEWRSASYGDELIYAAARDITERIRVEEDRERLLVQLRESAQQLRQIMDTVPAGVLLLEAGGRIVLANPLARDYLGLLGDAADEAVLTHLGESPLATFLTPSSSQDAWQEIAVGSHLFEASGRSLVVGSDSEGWVLVLRDVTQEREIQRSVQRQERLAVVGQLAAGIAHDFNNILAGIMLYSQMSLRMPDLPPKLKERLQVIIEQAQRAAELINQILDFSRRAVLDKRPLDLVPFVKEQVKLWRRTLPESIRVDCTVGAESFVVNADLTRMQQMLMNLVVNARDAMPDGGLLHLDVAPLRISRVEDAPLPEMLPGDWVRLAISDTGTGIPDDVLPRLFTPFFTTKAPGHGTGLGLAQVYGIVTSHEGRINVETQVGQGTSFRIYLPLLNLPESPCPDAALADLPLGHGELILVVEDNAMTRAAIVEGLQLLNYATLEASHGKEALDIFAQHSGEIALVLSDMVMPEMGGKALAQVLRQHTPVVPVIVLSGHPLDQDSDMLRSSGVEDWIQKPPDLVQLAGTLERAIGKRRKAED